MIKVFTLNKNNKIELTKKELEELLNESFWEGYNRKNTYIYNSPSVITTPTTPYWTYSTTKTVTTENSDKNNNINNEVRYEI